MQSFDRLQKLSLFLKTATRDQKLPNLSENIVTGNSLIDDPNVSGSALNWHERFPDIMNSGGFDVVIGNPPWQIIKADQAEFFTPLKEMQLLIATEFPNKNQKFSLLKAATKKRLVDKCLENDEIKERYDILNRAKDSFRSEKEDMAKELETIKKEFALENKTAAYLYASQLYL